jgi:hypothetical protein
MEENSQEKIIYTLKKSARAKRMRISVACDGKVVVTIPKILESGFRYRLLGGGVENMVEKFLIEKGDWIRKSLTRFRALPEWQKRKYTKRDYLENKEKTRSLVQERLTYFNQFYGFAWKRISIRNQKSRWGSCSRKGNLNFNYKLYFLPAELQDYIVVHELCHLGELNHSKKFWSLVEKTMPDYNERKKELRGSRK